MEHLRAHRVAASGSASGTRRSNVGKVWHLRTAARRAAIGTTTAGKRRCWPSMAITARPPTGKRSAADKHRRAGGSPGPSATRARLPRVICPRRGHGRGRFRMHISQTPLNCVLMCVPVTCDRARNPLAPLRFGRIFPNRSLRFWAESGAGSDPPPNVGSTAPQSGLMQALLLPVGGRSQPAPAARFIPAGRLRTRLGGGWAAGDVSGRRVVVDADEGIEPPRTKAALDLVGQLPDVGEPEGLRRAGGSLVRPRDAGGDHNGAPLRQERTSAGVLAVGIPRGSSPECRRCPVRAIPEGQACHRFCESATGSGFRPGIPWGRPRSARSGRPT